MERFIAALKLRQLEYFLAVAGTLHFTKAAQALCVTQPTLSHQIAELEAAIGTPLFDRLGRSVRLTSAGALFRTYAAHAIDELIAGRTALDELAGLQRGLLRIGVIQSFSRTLLPPILGEFLARYPAIRVTVQEMQAAAIERQLAAHTLDIGIAFAPGTLADTVLEALLEERLLLVVGHEHPLARRGRMRVAELQDTRLALLSQDFTTRRLIDAVFAAAGAHPEVVCETNSMEVILGTVVAGRLAAILPEYAIGDVRRRALRLIRLTDPVPVRVSALLWPKHGFRSAAARCFGEMVRARFLSGAPVS